MTELTIHGIVTRPVLVPLAVPVTTSVGAVTEAPLLLIDLQTDQGATGRAYLLTYQPFVLKPLDMLLRALAESISGQPAAPAMIEASLRARFTLLGGPRGLATMALAGIDMAVWDALATAQGIPLATLLGARPRAIRAYDSLGMEPVAQVAERVVRSAEAGFRGVKLKIGWPTLDEDLAVVRAARKALPDTVDLMADFNQSLSVAEAIRRGQALDSEGLSWIEEPVRCGDLRGAAQVAAAVATPIQIGENFSGPYEMEEALRLGAADYVMPDAQQIGGVTGWLRAAALAQTAGKECSSHLFVELSAHLLPATPTAHWLEYMPLTEAILREPLRPENGFVQAPEGPGVGLVWDEAAVQRYAMS